MPAYDPKTASPDFAAMEREILEYWRENGIFEKSVESRPEADAYVFYDGPPFANGLPHYGHLLTGYVKDAVARYQTMRGKRVERRFGWDCHGLPAEMGAEKELGVSGRKQITDYGVDKFNAECRKSVMQYAGRWKEYVRRQARWVDFDKGYKTMDRGYMESVLWAFKQLYDKGLIYESVRVMPYSWAAETPLSNFETRLDNSYRERTDKTVTALFTLKEIPACLEPFRKSIGDTPIKIAAWTTTPWTLPSNLALAVNPDMKYGLRKNRNDNTYTLNKVTSISAGSESAECGEEAAACGELEPFEFTSFTGSDLAGVEYEPLFPYFTDHVNRHCEERSDEAIHSNDAQENGLPRSGLRPPLAMTIEGNENDEKKGNAFRILAADFVTDDSGTGIVHLAPGFGEDDFTVCKANGIDIVCPVDDSGQYTDEIYDLPDLSLKGLNVVADTRKSEGEPYTKEQLEKYGLVNLRIITWLKKNGKLLNQEDFKHNYPHCWRTDTPLIYKAVPSWYVEVSKFKYRMVELNQQINWIPAHIKDGQFGKWLENARDWSISRNRFWGTPIPVWKNEAGDVKAFGSVKELEDFFGREVTDLHRPFIDSLVKTDENGTWRRVTDVFDCWFESGAMPFAQQHYPFDNKEKFEANFPADFIVEYVAQTRGWFYTLMVLSTALFDRPPFLNCICHGVVLDEKGQKLSKRLQNYADPLAVFDRYGADALRWVMLSSPIMQGGDLLIDKDCAMVRDAVRLALKPMWNAFHFFALYANADGITARLDKSSVNMMDLYILSECRHAVSHMRIAMDAYDLPAACKRFENFFEALNNWYIRRCKERFWKAEHDGDKIAAYNTLYSVLHDMTLASAPLLPLLCESIWQGLGNKSSVHLQDFPHAFDHEMDSTYSQNMARVRDICNAGLSIRNKEQIRVRQPLQTLYVVDPRAERLKQYAGIILEELNVKTAEFSSDVKQHADYNLKILFPVLGKRLPAKMKDIIAAVKKGEWTNDSGAVTVCGETLLKEEYTLLLQPKNAKGAAALSTQDGLVILDLTVTEELRLEGLMRDAVRLVQQSRKEADLPINARIQLYLHSNDADMVKALEEHKTRIADQTLADSVTIGEFSPENLTHAYRYDTEDGAFSAGIRLAK